MNGKRLAAAVLAGGVSALYLLPTAAVAAAAPPASQNVRIVSVAPQLLVPVKWDIPELNELPPRTPEPPPPPAAPEPPPVPAPPPGSWLTQENMDNAAIIVRVGQEMGMPRRAWEIAVATAMQESTLRNLGHLGDRNDHDSQGLFQQRPSQGWGTPEQITDPGYASRKFYEGLAHVPGWESMSLTAAAQAVQVSAYPNAYAKHESLAVQVVWLIAP